MPPSRPTPLAWIQVRVMLERINFIPGVNLATWTVPKTCNPATRLLFLKKRKERKKKQKKRKNKREKKRKEKEPACNPRGFSMIYDSSKREPPRGGFAAHFGL